ncbi:MAG TPA: Mrr restriction system protein [Thermoleophilia bacterium]|nr:Mrr restriction system protein [Thermoleophilia bacterium]
MADITPRRNGEMLREVFLFLLDKPDGARAKDILAHIGKTVRMSDFEKASYASTPGSPRWEKILRFASIATVKAGWLLKSKGVWSLTDEGRRAFEKNPDPEKFYKSADRIYREWRSNRPEPAGEPDLEEEVEHVRVTYELAIEDAWSELSDFLRRMDPYDFQDLVADLPKAMGYHVSWVAPRGKDAGVDIIAHTDPFGANPPRIKVQVKGTEDAAKVEVVRAFMSKLGDDDVGIFVCRGGFTKDAADEAREQERRKVTLVDEERLFELWVEHYDKLSQEARQRMPVRPIYFLAPGE